MRFIVIALLLLSIIGCKNTNTNTNTNTTNVTVDVSIPVAPTPGPEEESTPSEEQTNVALGASSGSSKDLEKLAAEDEQTTISRNAHYYSANFGLSDEVAYSNATSVYAYNLAKKEGNATTRELDILAMDVLGVDSKQIEDAFIDKADGDTSSYNSIVEEAARMQGISAEHMGSIIEEIL